jgi:ABC-type uncharacterized transport system substrate-binding protein
LIVAFQTPAITAAKQATTEIPIVMGASSLIRTILNTMSDTNELQAAALSLATSG